MAVHHDAAVRGPGVAAEEDDDRHKVFGLTDLASLERCCDVFLRPAYPPERRVGGAWADCVDGMPYFATSSASV